MVNGAIILKLINFSNIQHLIKHCNAIDNTIVYPYLFA